MKQGQEKRKYYFLLISIHGLVRGHDLELGRDADTGGQTKYVEELARSLAAHPDVERVDLLTRQIFDQRVGDDYAEPLEELSPNAYIVRVPFGPRRYLRKEALWPYLDGFIDNVLQHLRRIGRVPDIIHSHYADAGYVGANLSQMLGVPLVHTGHSLGRVKRQRLLDKGVSPENIEAQYNMTQRIEAEEITLGNTALVIASTQQEVDEQYSQYENYHPQRMVVIPPGVDLKRFRRARLRDGKVRVSEKIARFLQHPRKPMILAISRADERKNIATLVRAYGENSELQERANLVIVAGNRDDLATLDKGAQKVLQEILLLIDRYDLYGRVAIPKQHTADEIPEFYRQAARTRGVFVNPALTEPFGLTLIEAAASGLPVVATEDGGPRDILGHCQNGRLLDPLDSKAMGEVLLDAVTNRAQWQQWSRNGVRGSARHYTWDGHVKHYLREVYRATRIRQKKVRREGKSRLPSLDRILVCDIDNALLGDRKALKQLIETVFASGNKIGLGVATGRRLDSALKVLAEWEVPTPDILITGVGSEIFYGHGMVVDHGWLRHIDHQWHPDRIRRAMKGLPGIKLQPQSEQLKFKISYLVDPEKAPSMREVRRHLRKQDLHTKLIYSHEAFLDLLPMRASKGLAIRYVTMKWGLPPESLLVAGGSGNDEEMLKGNTLGVVVGNYSKELEKMRGKPRIYFAEQEYAWGIMEGMEFYNFCGDIRIPNDDE